MDDADLLRNRATRLFALAARSRQEGYSDYAEELVRASPPFNSYHRASRSVRLDNETQVRGPRARRAQCA